MDDLKYLITKEGVTQLTIPAEPDYFITDKSLDLLVNEQIARERLLSELSVDNLIIIRVGANTADTSDTYVKNAPKSLSVLSDIGLSMLGGD